MFEFPGCHLISQEPILHQVICESESFKVVVKKNDNCLSEFVWAVEQANAGDFVIPIQIDDGLASIRFVESQLLDLKATLAECLS